jgi:hypothetical protein
MSERVAHQWGLRFRGQYWLLDRGCDALPIALIGGMDTARRVAVVIPLDDSFPARDVQAATPARRPDGPHPPLGRRTP